MLVVSLEQAVAAPACTLRMADAGARVIKIERPEGDFARGYDRSTLGQSSYFVWLNRGKESAALDLRREADLRLLRSMIARADIFVQNLAPGAAARLGLSDAALRATNSRLITVSISGYGDEGPFANRKAYDLLIQAESALASVTGTADGPGRVGISVVDIATGHAAYQAALEALLARARTGEGREIRIAMFDVIAEWMSVPYFQTVYGGAQPARVGLAHPTIAPYGAFDTADGAILIAVQNDREWTRLLDALDATDLAADPRFGDNTGRVAHRVDLDVRLGAILRTRSTAQVVDTFMAHDLPFGQINDVAGLNRHPQLRRTAVATPSGVVEAIAPPYRLADEAPLGSVPALGAHTDALRAEFGDASDG
jgi:crotonobetainyl-CoA:carnitine CoA-transferase CaiB-like acyl-CoA transferase